MNDEQDVVAFVSFSVGVRCFFFFLEGIEEGRGGKGKGVRRLSLRISFKGVRSRDGGQMRRR